MANYPQLDDCSGVWTLKEVNDAVMGGYWREAGSRGVFQLGYAPSISNIIDYVTISSAGNAADFGDTTQTIAFGAGGGNQTRGVFAGYNTPGTAGRIDYITLASLGNAATFGSLANSRSGGSSAMSNSTRCVFGGGYGSPGENKNFLDYITIASTGNAIDFGDLTVARSDCSGAASPTRGFTGGGKAPGKSNVIDFITLASTGNATDFGNLAATTSRLSACSSSTRGVFGAGYTPTDLTTLQYITIASQGNTTDYGDVTAASYTGASTSNSVRAVKALGRNSGGTQLNTIEHFQISNGGTAVDFGDLTTAGGNLMSTSQSHGGLNDGYQGTRFIDSPIGRPVPRGGGVGDLSVKVGGEGAAAVALIGFNIISTAGNENLFGDLTNGARYDTNGCAGDTRMFTWSGTLDGTGGVNSIDYLTFSHKGNTADFGDATQTRQVAGCLANSTRALGAGGGTPSNSDVIDYITIATIGNASDFGDLTSARKGPGGLASTTRGIFAGGTGLSNVIEYVTIASTSNGTDFGDLTQARRSPGATSSSTRGVFAGGRRVDSPAAESEVIDYITIASTGDASDFGDLTQNRAFLDGTSNSTRAIFTGGYVSTNVNTIDYITIASTGDASDFGDLMLAARGAASGSNGHGGLS